MNPESWWTERRSGSQVSCLFILFRQIIPTVIILLSREKNGLTWTIFCGFLFPSTKGQKTILLEPDHVFQLNYVWLSWTGWWRHGWGRGGRWWEHGRLTQGLQLSPCSAGTNKGKAPGPLLWMQYCNHTGNWKNKKKIRELNGWKEQRQILFIGNSCQLFWRIYWCLEGDDSFCARILGKAALFLASSYLTHLPLANKGWNAPGSEPF